MLLGSDDERLAWHGAISVHHADGWAQPWRLPYEERGLFPPDLLLERAAMPAGVRLAFRSDTTRVGGSIAPQAEDALLDVCCDGAVVGSIDLAGRDRFSFDGLPAGEKTIELWLPQASEFRLRALELSDGAMIAPFVDDRPRWITYGSSITQCRAAASPTRTWPAIVAREHGLHLTCLGFGGQCHLDPSIARLIRDQPADFLSICVGINIYGAASLSPRSFRPAIIGFVRTIRERRAETPFAVLSPIYSPPRETESNAVGFTLQMMRDEVAEAVEALRAHGDRNLHYVDGLDVFGSDYAHLLPDDLHPDAEGYQVMGRNFLDRVATKLFA